MELPNARNGPQSDRPQDLESHSFIDSYGSSVSFADMQEGLDAGGRVIPHQSNHQRPSVALAYVAGMGANPTELTVTRHAQPFAGHSD